MLEVAYQTNAMKKLERTNDPTVSNKTDLTQQIPPAGKPKKSLGFTPLPQKKWDQSGTISEKEKGDPA
jgi:hypothetical protein